MDPAARLSRRRGDAPAGDGSEIIEIRAGDGHALRATVREPPRGVRSQGVAVLAHAMFARRSEWERASFAAFLQERGWRTIAFDFRGHGDSGPSAAKGGRWTYDDLAQLDLPAVVQGARARAGRGKVIVVGHSLGGHVAVASRAMGLLDADRIALVAANVWLRECEPSARRWVAKLALTRAFDEVVDRVGRFPARALRIGSDDECGDYVRALTRVVREQWWGTADRRVDYWDAMRAVRVPLFALASDGDPINCAVDCASRFALRAPGHVTFERIRACDDGSRAPGHMEIVTERGVRSAWVKLEGWMRA